MALHKQEAEMFRLHTSDLRGGQRDGENGKRAWKLSVARHLIESQNLEKKDCPSWVEAGNSACLSRCPRGERTLVELYLVHASDRSHHKVRHTGQDAQGS